MSNDVKKPAGNPAPPGDAAAKPQRAAEPQAVPAESTDESMTGEEDPGASLDSMVNPAPPAKRPS